MFTGIIEEIGSIAGVKRGAKSSVLTVNAAMVLEDVRLGDSIAVNGVCLTVTGFTRRSFTADVMHETLNRSSLGSLSSGSPVNLERAMAANGRFGGHIVSGHIDGTGAISNIKKDDNAIWYTIMADEKILRYVVQKGSIAIDGISLTVAKVDKESFSVSIIPHTAQKTILSTKKTGDRVNLETDCIGKYVEKMLLGDLAQGIEPQSRGLSGSMRSTHAYRTDEVAAGSAGGNPSRGAVRGRNLTAGSTEETGLAVGGITKEFLLKNGF